MVKNLLLLVHNGSTWVQSNTTYENGQNSPKQSWENNLIFEYIWIFWTNIFIRKNICWFFLGQIYSDIHSWSFYHAEYIRIFIRSISMVTNIFGYSFVQKNVICPTHNVAPHSPFCMYQKSREALITIRIWRNLGGEGRKH